MENFKKALNSLIDDYNLDIIALFGIILFGIYMFFISPMMYITSSDAVIDGHIINVSSKADGMLINSYIVKDQEVKKGDMIMELNPEDYNNQLVKLEYDLEICKEKLRLLTGENPEDIMPEIKQNNVNSENSEELNENQPITQEEVKPSKPPKYMNGSNNINEYSRTYEPEEISQKNLTRKKIAAGDMLTNMSDVNTQNNAINTPKPMVDKTKLDVSNDTPDSIKKEIKNITNLKEELNLKIAGTKIYAPCDGIITSVSVVNSDIIRTSQVLCTIQPKQVWVIARVNPMKLHKIHIGQTVRVKIPNYKYRSFKGMVTSVDRTTKVYKIKNYENSEMNEEDSSYQIKIDFTEDYSDFNIPPDTKVQIKIKVKDLI